MKKFGCLVFLMTASVLSTAMLAAAGELQASLRACVAEQDPVKRLACYDREVARAGTPAAVDGAAATAGAAKQMTAEERFGYRGVVAKGDIEQTRKSNSGLDELQSTVTALTKRPFGELIVTLANGQVWAQKLLDENFSLAVGDTVAVKPAALSSYLLISPAGRSTRVSRLR